MPEVGLATDLSKPELRQPAQANLSNPLMNLVRGVWLPFRRLIAELRAFPIVLTRRNGCLVVTARLPGLQGNEVRVEVTDDMVVIDAEPKRDKDRPLFRAGRRLIPLPELVEIALAEAELKNGVLTVSLPTRYARKHRHVPVECGDDPPSGGAIPMSPNDRTLLLL
jgi:HSP20 family molecular chaperone IbpA